MATPEFENTFNKPFIPVQIPEISYFPETPRGPRFSIRGPLPMMDLNDYIAKKGIIRVIPRTEDQLGQIAFDAPVFAADGKELCNIQIVVDIDQATVQWNSTFPDFQSASRSPIQIGDLRTSACFGSNDKGHIHGEIVYVLDQIGQALQKSDIPNKASMIATLERRY